MRKSFRLGFAACLLPTFPLGYFWHLTTIAAQYKKLDMYRAQILIPLGIGSMLIQCAWSFTTLPVAAKYRMTSVADFMVLETSFTALQLVIVAPLMALAYRRSA